MAKANAVTGSSYYVEEGVDVPTDLHPDVRLVGPGVPSENEEEPNEDYIESDIPDVEVEPEVSEDEAGYEEPEKESQQVVVEKPLTGTLNLGSTHTVDITKNP
jgi:hypothetical protein